MVGIFVVAVEHMSEKQSLLQFLLVFIYLNCFSSSFTEI